MLPGKVKTLQREKCKFFLREHRTFSEAIFDIEAQNNTEKLPGNYDESTMLTPDHLSDLLY